MVVSTSIESPNLVIATLQGVVRNNDQAEVVGWVRAQIRRAGSVNLLIRLEAFGGWYPNAPFEGATSWLDDDEGVLKIGIVGRPEWRARVLLIMTQALRRLPIRYFESETDARAWLQPESGAPAGTPV